MFDDVFGRGSYEVKTICRNCKTRQVTKIKKGHLAEDVIENGACENCGCKMLEVIK